MQLADHRASVVDEPGEPAECRENPLDRGASLFGGSSRVSISEQSAFGLGESLLQHVRPLPQRCGSDLELAPPTAEHRGARIEPGA